MNDGTCLCCTTAVKDTPSQSVFAALEIPFSKVPHILPSPVPTKHEVFKALYAIRIKRPSGGLESSYSDYIIIFQKKAPYVNPKISGPGFRT